MEDNLISAREAVHDPAQLATDLTHLHVADIVEVLDQQSVATASRVLNHLSVERAAEVLDQPGLDFSAELIASLPEERAVAVLSAMSADRVANVFRHLEEPVRSKLLGRLGLEAKTSLQELLAYPPNTAGSIMTTEFVSVPTTWRVGRTLEHIRRVERTRETVYAIYVLDPETKALVQTVSLRRLITGETDAPILSVSTGRKPVTVTPLTDREEVARLISKYDLLAVPVLDEKRRVVGIVTVDDVIDAIVEESTEDVQKFGGVLALHEPYMEIGFVGMIRKRAGWLCALVSQRDAHRNGNAIFPERT